MDEKWEYYGLFIDKEARKKILNEISDYGVELLDKVYLDHCTLIHRSQYAKNQIIADRLERMIDYGQVGPWKITLTHIGKSDKAMALKVRFGNPIPCANTLPHITIGTFQGGKPVDSNGITNWIELETPIEVYGILKCIEHR